MNSAAPSLEDSEPSSIQISYQTHPAPVVLWKVIGPWTWEDFDLAVIRTSTIIKKHQSSKRLIVMIDLLEHKDVPSGGVAHIHQAFMKCHYKKVTVILCHVDLFLRLLIASYLRVFRALPHQILTCHNTQQGWEVVRTLTGSA